MPAREVWRLALDGQTTALAVVRRWRWWRCDVTERPVAIDGSVGDSVQLDDVRRELSAEGTVLPSPIATPLPWDLDATGTIVAQASAVRRVRALVRPTLAWTIAGLGLHDAIEDAPRDGGPGSTTGVPIPDGEE
jgi:hypothetical protein